ncbi:MAG: hypothetical protein FK730_16080 [Asgard group archaeon]|nr:hypothetical protein [Asgard group archaeon]
MDQGNNIVKILVEFDSMKGPIIRKKEPKNYEFPEGAEIDAILMWILRASEFSVRKIGEQTAYAKILSLNDPNFQRKKRQFGIAIITKETIELKTAEELLEKIIKQAQSSGNDKPYFKMLKELLAIIGNTQGIPIGLNETEQHKRLQPEVSLKVQNKSQNLIAIENTNQFEQFLLMSKKLIVFNKVKIMDKSKESTFIISSVETFGKIDMDIGQIAEIITNRYNFEIDLRNYCPPELEQGFELLSRILEALPQDSTYNERLVVAIEFLDRLIDEQVDLEYYLPFLQYLIAMENYTITEFLNEEFNKQLHNLKETHGDWIESLSKNNLDGKRLSNFFKVTGVRREGLELLVDLLFIKIIAIY